MTNIIEKPLTYFRAPKATSKKLRVDRTGGDYGAGIIYGASLITQGEAIGHGMWLDKGFIAAVDTALGSNPQGIKVRFTHPGLSGDGLGSFMGRAKNGSVSGLQALADIHFSKSAHKSPDGDLAEYVMDLAEEDPEAFAMSIVFKPDFGAEDRFVADHEDEDGNFQSPDEDNVSNLPHARLADLRAADFVDEPAANPNGLFHRGQEIADEADRLCSYALGLSKEKPELTLLSADVDRLASFAARFLDTHKLEVRDISMSNAQTTDKPLSREDVLGIVTESFGAFKAEIMELFPKKDDAPEEPALSQADLLNERKRGKELFALAKNAGIPNWEQTADQWIDKGLSVVEAKATIADIAIAKNGLSNDSGDDNDDPHAKFRAEFRAGKVEFQKFGIVDEDAYVRTRCRDEGLPVPEIKKAS